MKQIDPSKYMYEVRFMFGGSNIIVGTYTEEQILEETHIRHVVRIMKAENLKGDFKVRVMHKRDFRERYDVYKREYLELKWAWELFSSSIKSLIWNR